MSQKFSSIELGVGRGGISVWQTSIFRIPLGKKCRGGGGGEGVDENGGGGGKSKLHFSLSPHPLPSTKNQVYQTGREHHKILYFISSGPYLL